MNQKLAEARILAARKMPYLTHQVMTLIPVERPGLGTMAVDEYCRMYFDPAFLEARHSRQWAVGSRQWRGKRGERRGDRRRWTVGSGAPLITNPQPVPRPPSPDPIRRFVHG
jgi:hypothetical protein